MTGTPYSPTGSISDRNTRKRFAIRLLECCVSGLVATVVGAPFTGIFVCFLANLGQEYVGLDEITLRTALLYSVVPWFLYGCFNSRHSILVMIVVACAQVWAVVICALAMSMLFPLPGWRAVIGGYAFIAGCICVACSAVIYRNDLKLSRITEAA